MSLGNRLRDWWREGTSSPTTEPPFINGPPSPDHAPPGGYYNGYSPEPNGFWLRRDRHPDPHSSVRAWRTSGSNSLRMITGLDCQTSAPLLTPLDSSLVYLGEPGTGKTSCGTGINSALPAAGVTVLSTRSDNHRLASMLLARGGPIWTVDATGHGLQGAKNFAHSILDGLMVNGVPNERRAKERAERIVGTLGMNRAAREAKPSEGFWGKGAADLAFAGMMIDLRTGERFGRDFLAACARADDEYLEGKAQLLRSSPELAYRNAGDFLAGFVKSSFGQRAGIYAHTVQQFAFWRSEEGLRVEEQARASGIQLADIQFGDAKAQNHFAPDLLHYMVGNGDWQTGWYPSFIIPGAPNEDPAKAYVTEFVSSQMKLLEERAEAQYRAGAPSGPPHTFVLEEMFRAGLGELVDKSADARDRGYLICGGAQNTHQLDVLYGLNNISQIRSTFGTIVLLGSVEVDVASDISEMMKRYLIELKSTQHQSTGEGVNFGVQEQLYPELSVDEIARGHTDRQVALQLNRDGSWNYVRLTPYYEGPWLNMWAKSVIWSINSEVGLDYPVPLLTRNGYRSLDAIGLGEPYRAAMDAYETHQREEADA